MDLIKQLENEYEEVTLKREKEENKFFLFKSNSKIWYYIGRQEQLLIVMEKLCENKSMRTKKEIQEHINSLNQKIKECEIDNKPNSKELILQCNLKISAFMWVLKEI